VVSISGNPAAGFGVIQLNASTLSRLMETTRTWGANRNRHRQYRARSDHVCSVIRVATDSASGYKSSQQHYDQEFGA
jgi:hypothetical protein